MSGKWEVKTTVHRGCICDPQGRIFAEWDYLGSSAGDKTELKQAIDVVRKLNAFDGLLAACKDLGSLLQEIGESIFLPGASRHPWPVGSRKALKQITDAIAATEPEGGKDEQGTRVSSD